MSNERSCSTSSISVEFDRTTIAAGGDVTS
jgi:hypothetical protein